MAAYPLILNIYRDTKGYYLPLIEMISRGHVTVAYEVTSENEDSG